MEDAPELPTEDDIKILEKLKLNSRFNDYSMNELVINALKIVLKK